MAWAIWILVVILMLGASAMALVAWAFFADDLRYPARLERAPVARPAGRRPPRPARPDDGPTAEAESAEARRIATRRR
ncbi:MAG TPA: hypothetical protein VFP57_00060 [Sphingomicrobium sp.]|jgi:hypothetical protein|nr:hypothetical protein [Sphingomicrobium sp.]